MDLVFGEWTPDLPPHENSGITVATNVLPFGNSYKSFPSNVVYTSALSGPCIGASSGRDNAGNAYNFAGTASKLNQMVATSWNDVSKVGGYSTASEDKWRFSQSGAKILATNFADPIQAFTLGSSSVFANLAAAAPKAKYITSVRSQVVVANVNDTFDGVVPYRLWWSGIGDDTAWTPSATTQCDFDDLNSAAGWIQGIVGGEYGVIFQENAISLMTYIGSPIIFRFDEVEKDRGTPAPGSIIKVGNFIFYLGQDGFYVFDGQQSTPIGDNKIDKTFYAEVDQSYMGNIVSTVDPINKIVLWAYPASGNTGGRCNRILAYNYSPNATKRWTRIETDIEYLYKSLALGYTLDGLDAVSTNLDALLFSLDSRVWTGNSALLSGFDSSHRQVNFTGTALDATIETQEAEINPNMRTLVTLLRPFVESGSSISIYVGTRNSLSDAVTWSAAMTPNNAGNFPMRSNARYHRVRVVITGGFSHAQGMNIVKQIAVGMR